MAAVIFRMANKKLEQVYIALTDNKNCVEPYGAGITNTICQVELAAIAAAITHSYSHMLQIVSSLLN
eukprot:1141069-Pelagomonas_calceolata.AAC.1